MSTSDAWLLECGESLAVAVGDHEMVELLSSEHCQRVPGTPAHCSSVLVWQDDIVPVMDLGPLHDGAESPRDRTYQCLLHYQEAPNAALQLLALEVLRAPERIRVDDAQFCEFPREHADSLLRGITLSCFTHHARPVLVLDIASLCSAGFREFAAAP